MSLKTMISNQIQMKNMKNHSIDQKTWPVPNSVASMASIVCFSPLVLWAPHPGTSGPASPSSTSDDRPSVARVGRPRTRTAEGLVRRQPVPAMGLGAQSTVTA